MKCNCAQRGDALELLGSLQDACAALAFFDPQHRSTLARLQYGNEGSRQVARCALPQMTDEYINNCCRGIARVLRPSGYLMLWSDAFRLLTGYHQHFADVLKAVDLIAWDNLRMGMGYRARRRGEYLLVTQKEPLKAKATWSDHGIPDRWVERIGHKTHPHQKPIELIRRLITATTRPGDLVIDPAAGSFVAMTAVLAQGCQFIGCDINYEPSAAEPRKLMEQKMTDDDLVCRFLDETAAAESREEAANVNEARGVFRNMTPEQRDEIMREFYALCEQKI